jgi:hypothetical protein
MRATRKGGTCGKQDLWRQCVRHRAVMRSALRCVSRSSSIAERSCGGCTFDDRLLSRMCAAHARHPAFAVARVRESR